MRHFTDEQLEEMGKLTRDLIKEAIDRGDLERAKQLSDRMYREFSAMHDLYLYWVTATLTHIGRNYGDQALYQALKEGCAAWVMPLAQRYAAKDTKTKAEMLVAGLRGHLQPLRVEEDDEKFTIYMEPCGSGGRLIINSAYRPPHSFLSIEEAQPMTFGRQDFPVYCAHCPFEALLPIEAGLVPFAVAIPAGDLANEPCRVCLYKNAADIPSVVFEQAGLDRDEFIKKTSSPK
jgi:hypothetical protein